MRKHIALLLTLVMVLSLVTVPSFAGLPENLVVNGDFELGNTDFVSEYEYKADISGVQNELYPPYVYGVGYSPFDYHTSWADFGDHTDGSGLMMIVNASHLDPDKIVWSENLDLPVCEPELIESRYPLYAGQTMLVGEVLVNWVDNHLCVEYVLNDDALNDGWLIVETHVAVADEAGDIPQKKGNPIPGHFPEGDTFDPGVEAAGPYCFELDPEWELPYIVAAHAVIEREVLITPAMAGTELLISDEETMVVDGNVEGASYPAPAVAMTPGTYAPTTWTSQTGSDTWPGSPIWIWEQNPVVHPILGDVVYFEKTFTLPGVPTVDGQLKIAADNGYAVWLNGKFIGTDNINLLVGADETYPVYGDATLGNLMETYIPWTTWQDVGTYVLPMEDLIAGENVLKILAVNEYMNTDDVSNPVGTTGNNPGGLVFSGEVDWEVPAEYEYESESAWGGENEFEGKNWAKYISYVPEFEPCDYDFEFSFYAANSYSTNLAVLEIYINGDLIGEADLNEIVDPIVGNWKGYSFLWNSGGAALANIVIKNSITEYDGDDYCLDDISLIKE